MAAKDVLRTDKAAFESGLVDLIGAALTPASPHSQLTRKRSAGQQLTRTMAKASRRSRSTLGPRGAQHDAPDTANHSMMPGPSVDTDSITLYHAGFPYRDKVDSARNSPADRPINFDPSKPIRSIEHDDVEYQLRLQRRRRECVRHVDRYVPDMSSSKPTRVSAQACWDSSEGFQLAQLPEDVQKKIYENLLVALNPIVIDSSWLRSFVNAHARIPEVAHKLNGNALTYDIPIPLDELVSSIGLMQQDMAGFREALEVRGVKTKSTRSPCRGLSMGLLQVSTGVKKIAAEVFYGQNTFQFPCSTSAWMQLESFLDTIGPGNVAHIKHLRK